MVALAVMATAAAAVVALAGAVPEVRAVVPKVFTLNNTRPYPKHKKKQKLQNKLPHFNSFPSIYYYFCYVIL